jgi:hypothetical protein
VPPSLPCDIEEDTPMSRNEQEKRPVAQLHFEPMCQALSIMKPGFNFEGVDLVTNRNNLRKLFDFIGNKRPRAFRIDLDIIHNTLLMTRREKSDSNSHVALVARVMDATLKVPALNTFPILRVAPVTTV